MDQSTGILENFSLFITKASIDDKGVMKWAAVNSDTDPDSYEERMSVELYRDFIEHIKNEDPIPEVFRSYTCSSFWCGGMPYLSVSHYPDLNGNAVPGEPLHLYVDGDSKNTKLKATGILFDSPLGHSVYRSLKEDKYKSPEEKIRISIGFLDLAHKHGDNGSVWVRENLSSVCEECKSKVGNKIYLKGYLVHLALTRVPVNKRTEFVEENAMTTKAVKKTRKEDAASIVGKELAEEIEIKNKASALKSDVLVEMSEDENKTAVSEVSEDAPIAEKAEQIVEDAVEIEKSEPVMEPVSEKMDDTPTQYYPYNGATSMKEAEKAKEAVEEMTHVMDLWGMFSSVAWNIIDRSDVADKKEAFIKAVDEFKGMLAAKAMVTFGMIEKSEVVELIEKPHELKPALDALLSAVDNSLTLEGDLGSKLQFINPSLQELGQAITDMVSTKSVAIETPAPDKNNDSLLNDIKELIQPLSDSVRSLADEVGVLKAKADVRVVETKSRIPAPRTLSSSLVQNPVAKKSTSPTPNLHSIINRSVGVEE